MQKKKHLYKGSYFAHYSALAEFFNRLPTVAGFFYEEETAATLCK